MARPPNPETIAALKKRIEKLEESVAALRSTRNLGPSPLKLYALIEELDASLGLSPGTLERRIKDRRAGESTLLVS